MPGLGGEEHPLNEQMLQHAHTLHSSAANLCCIFGILFEDFLVACAKNGDVLETVLAEPTFVGMPGVTGMAWHSASGTAL